MRYLLTKCHCRLVSLRKEADFWCDRYQQLVEKTGVTILESNNIDFSIQPESDEVDELTEGLSLSNSEFVLYLKNTLPEYCNLLQELGYKVRADDKMFSDQQDFQTSQEQPSGTSETFDMSTSNDFSNSQGGPQIDEHDVTNEKDSFSNNNAGNTTGDEATLSSPNHSSRESNDEQQIHQPVAGLEGKHS